MLWRESGNVALERGSEITQVVKRTKVDIWRSGRRNLVVRDMHTTLVREYKRQTPVMAEWNSSTLVSHYETCLTQGIQNLFLRKQERTLWGQCHRLCMSASMGSKPLNLKQPGEFLKKAIHHSSQSRHHIGHPIPQKLFHFGCLSLDDWTLTRLMITHEGQNIQVLLFITGNWSCFGSTGH